MRSRVGTAALIFLFALAVRLPFFFRSGIDGDESTFILIGQSMLDGHLPYVYLWDVKPPLLFAFFSAAIEVLGRSLVAVRFAGLVCVAVTGVLVYVAASRRGNRLAAGFAACLCILVTSLLPSGQATMSEHVLLPFLMSAVLMLGGDIGTRRVFWIGVLMAVATLVRTNIAVAAAVAAIIIAVEGRRHGRGLQWIGLYAAGGCAVAISVCLPFVVAGELSTLWRSVVVAALERSRSAQSIAVTSSQLLLSVLGAGPRGYLVDSRTAWLGAFVWLVVPVAAIAAWLARSIADAGLRRGGTVTGLVAAAVALSIAASGEAHPHYLIQVVPFAALAFSMLAGVRARAARLLILAMACGVAASSAGPIMDEYRTMLARRHSGLPLSYGPSFELAEFFRRENASGKPVLLLGDHLAYWLVDVRPATRFAAHPSTLSRDQVLRIMGTSAERELDIAFQNAPAFVVMEPDDWIVEGSLRTWLASVLARDYVRDPSRIGGMDVYRRRSQLSLQTPNPNQGTSVGG